jgi:hypothetical protein
LTIREHGSTAKASDRVTRLGELSPNGQLFSLGGFWKITEVHSPHFGLLFSTAKALLIINLEKKKNKTRIWRLFS